MYISFVISSKAYYISGDRSTYYVSEVDHGSTCVKVVYSRMTPRLQICSVLPGSRIDKQSKCIKPVYVDLS